MAAYGLYTHIQSNKRRSIGLLIALFFLVYVLVYAGALAGEAMSYDASLPWLLQRAWRDLLRAAPWATPKSARFLVSSGFFFAFGTLPIASLALARDGALRCLPRRTNSH
jgi:heat shock protein HtpX